MIGSTQAIAQVKGIYSQAIAQGPYSQAIAQVKCIFPYSELQSNGQRFGIFASQGSYICPFILPLSAQVADALLLQGSYKR